MATAATGTRVARLRADGQTKAEEAARFFETLTVEQALTKTEIGWTVAATAAHLASGAGFSKQQIAQLARGKAPRVPGFVIDTVNFLTTRANRKKPLAESATKLREATDASLALLDDWSDTALEKQFDTPYYGANTYEEALRYSLLDHFDEHLGQIKRALR
jgi:hypothetical protein